jgi:hypothetical protein
MFISDVLFVTEFEEFRFLVLTVRVETEEGEEEAERRPYRGKARNQGADEYGVG